MSKDQDRQRLRNLLLEGAASPPAVTADADYFQQLRERAGRAPSCSCSIQSRHGIDRSR